MVFGFPSGDRSAVDGNAALSPSGSSPNVARGAQSDRMRARKALAGSKSKQKQPAQFGDEPWQSADEDDPHF